MGTVVYTLGGLIGFCCAFLLLRSYGRTGKKLLLWSGLCFLCLGISNALIYVDLILLPSLDLYLLRLVTAAVAMILLLYGLVWESE